MFWNKKNKPKASTEETFPPVKVVIRTDLGNVRTNNEDSAAFFRVADEAVLRSRGYLLIVADGMGGHLAGEVASKMAVDTISTEYFKKAGTDNIEKCLAKSFAAANKKIFEMAAADERYRGMGTTCTALAIIGKTIHFAHAGDSRAYLYTNQEAVRITEDHTYVQQLVKNGDITATEADVHPQRNILTNAMGTKPDLRVDTGKCEQSFGAGDRLLICSDGLYDYLDDHEIAAVLADESIRHAADYFIAEAKRRGGLDNITVILAEPDTTDKATTAKTTRDIYLAKPTRDADLPINNNVNL